MLADAFLDWLVDALASAGVQAGLRLVRGAPAEREMRKVMEAALDAAMQQVPEDSRDGLHVALREQFSQPPRLLIGSGVPVREALKSSIRAQIGPLGDPKATTVTGHSYLQVIGVDSDWLTDALVGATIEAILETAARSGIAALATQLNAESIGDRLDLLLALFNDDESKLTPLNTSSLPLPVVGFTGRQEELSELRASWSESRAASVVWSIAGPAGIGKSALAIHFAHEVASEFPDGQLYVDLRGAEDGARLNQLDVLRQFLKALGAPSEEIPPSAGERAGMFRSLLRNRRFLILLDNAYDETQVRLLLPGSPGCLVLITSRRPLAALDTLHPPLQLGVLDEQDAMEMLSRLAGPDRVQAELEQAAEVVRLCGGLPLALRIVAGRLRTRPQWPVSGILGRLVDERRRLVELRTGDLDVRASFMLSYRELSDSEALLFRRLGILPGTTFDLLLATAVGGQTVVGGSASAISVQHSFDDLKRRSAAVQCGTEAIQDDEIMVREKIEAELEDLMDAQLIEFAALGHYRMHDLVHLFASELLQNDDAHSAEEFMASFNYVLWAQAQADAAIAWTAISPSDLPARYQQSFRSREEVDDWLERSRLNLVTAVRMAYEDYQDKVAVDLAMALWYLFQMHGFWPDLEPVLDTAQAAAHRSGDFLSEAEVLYRLGTLRLSKRSFLEAVEALEESLALLTSDEANERRAEILTYLANALTCTGRLDDAEACLAEAEYLMQAPAGATPPNGAAAITGERATLLELRGDTAGALSAFERALEISRNANDTLRQAAYLERIGCIYLRQHLRAPAIQYFEESLALCQDGDIYLRVRSEATLSLARAHMIDGVTGEATKLLNQALEDFQRLQIPEKEAEVLCFQLLAYKKLRKWDLAQECWIKALEALERANPETVRGMRDLIGKSRPQKPATRRPRPKRSRQKRANRRRRE